MKLDCSFEREITKTANGDGSRAYKFEFKPKVKGVADYLSENSADECYDTTFRKFGRVPVALCTAATIVYNKRRLSREALAWAEEVLKLWWNRTESLDDYVIHGNLHPTKIEVYSKSFRSITTDSE